LRHLLTHTSGLTYSNWSDKLPQYEKVTGQADIAESKNGAFAAPLEFDPGERWQYGIGMDAVGKIVEAVSDQSLEIYFRENIFAPLGMTDTGFLISSAQKRRVATTYTASRTARSRRCLSKCHSARSSSRAGAACSVHRATT
jgi:CubicO group peptidase (beta-lactamase class C family)